MVQRVSDIVSHLSCYRYKEIVTVTGCQTVRLLKQKTDHTYVVRICSSKLCNYVYEWYLDDQWKYQYK